VRADLPPQEILSLPLDGPGFLVSNTVGQYLMSTLRKFTRLQDGFDSKRVFGSGDWEDPLILAFANADLIWLRTDENGLIDDYPSDAFWKIVNDLSDFLFDAEFSTIQRVLPPPPPKEWYLVCVDRDSTLKGQLTDYFKEPYTEEEARIQAEIHNKPYSYHAWSAVHIPTVS